MTFIDNQSNISYQIQKVESSQSYLYGAFWLAGEIPWDGNYKGRLHTIYHAWAAVGSSYYSIMKSCILIIFCKDEHNVKIKVNVIFSLAGKPLCKLQFISSPEPSAQVSYIVITACPSSVVRRKLFL